MHFIVGGSGIPNYGDELMAKGWLSYLATHRPQERVVLECAIPSVSTLMLQPANWHASHTSIIKDIAAKIPNDTTTLWNAIAAGLDFFRKGGLSAHPRLQVAEQHLAQAKTFHLMGGGYINDKWPSNGFLLGFAAAMKERYTCKIAATGIGLFPIKAPSSKADEAILRRVISAFDIFETRDRQSAEFLQRHAGGNITSGLDDCFLAPLEPVAHEPTLHISCFLGTDKAADLADALALHRDAIHARFKRIVFWMCAPHRDADAMLAIRAKFPSIEVADVQSLISGNQISPADLMISNRFHPHLMAARAGAGGYFDQIRGDYYGVKHGSVLALGSAFRPLSDLAEHGVDVAPSMAMATADADRVARKQAVAALIYGQP